MTYYEILGVSKSSSKTDMNHAYRKKAKELHPDANKNLKDANRRMTELNNAYNILKDPIRRQEYDSTIENENAFSKNTFYKDNYYRSKTTNSTQSQTTQSKTRSSNVKKTGFNIKHVFWTILLIYGLSVIFQSPNNSNGNTTANNYVNNIPVTVSTPTYTPIPTYTRQYTLDQKTSPTTITEPTIDCTGPDGKHLFVTQKECDDFNNAWKPTLTPTNIEQYNYSNSYPTLSCSNCGNNSHCSYGSCICNDGFAKNYSNNQCEQCPANSTGSYGTCTCNHGYEKNYSSGTCDPCPANSTSSYGICTCNNGYKKNYSTGQCEELNCPANSSVQYGYCICNNGYSMNYSTNQCEPI